jgi:predicted nucleotidyltransferase
MIKESTLSSKDRILSSRDSVSRIAERYGLELVVLYGSIAKGTDHMGSDVDLAVLPTDIHIFTAEKEGECMDALANVFKMPVEMSLLHTSSITFAHEVMETGVPLYEREVGVAARYRVHVWKTWLEMASLREARNKHTEVLLRALTNGTVAL